MASQQRRNLRSSTATAPRASRHARPIISYRESSSETASQLSETEDQDGSDVSALEGSLTSRSYTQKTDKIKEPQQQHRSRISRKPSHWEEMTVTGRKRNRLADSRSNHHGTPIITLPSALVELDDSATIPAWTSLPYEILISIFLYASYPLCDERTFQSTPSVNWLIGTSRLCRAFAEPALTVLYRSPPLVPMDKAHMLRQLLMADPVPMSYNYRAKVERLQMEVSQTAAYTLSGSGLLDLYGLIFHCPRLLDLELYHQKDFWPHRRLDDSVRWTYPDSLFVALDSNVSGNPTRLRSWRWSSRLAGKKRPIENLLKIHLSPAFSSLRKIAFVNYQKLRARKNMDDPGHEKLLAESLSALLHLEHLVFESTTLVNSILLPLLPKNLKHLEIINCSEVDSDDIANFLLSHGTKLRTLILNHNVSLNLSFLTILGSCCRNLELLRMNLTYSNAHSSYRDSDPVYDALLSIDERPHWPASLRTIELTQLRRWESDTAKMFFQSLLDSASNLVNLRRLVIKAMLNTSWRDRSSFRDEWIGAFQRVFKRPVDESNPQTGPLGDHPTRRRRDNASSSQQFSRNDNDRLYSDDDILQRPLKHRRLANGVEATRDELRPQRSRRLANGNHLMPLKEGTQIPIRNHEGEEESNAQNKMQLQAPGIRRSMRIAPTKLGLEDRPAGLSLKVEKAMHERHHLANLSNVTAQVSFRESKRSLTVSRELKNLQETAGADGFSGYIPINASDSSAHSEYNSGSDDIPLVTPGRAQKRNKIEHIQGMCDVVSIIIDNLRPTENQFVEADFLDSEPEGDEDWDGSEDVPGDGRYAW